MSQNGDFLKRVANKLGLTRESYDDQSLPSDFNNVSVMCFFGDLRSTFVFSSIFSNKSPVDNYQILISWPGFKGIFPRVNEYWTTTNADSLSKLIEGASFFSNASDYFNVLEKRLMKYLENVSSSERFLDFFSDSCFNSAFVKEWKNAKFINVPTVGNSIREKLFKKHGKKILIFPAKWGKTWRRFECNRELGEIFWKKIINGLSDLGFVPVVVENIFTHDFNLEADVIKIDVNYSIVDLLSLMRACDCCLDIFSGYSRLCYLARAPFLYCDEYNRYKFSKDFEIDELFNKVSIPHDFLLLTENSIDPAWHDQLINDIGQKLTNVLNTWDLYNLPSSLELEVDLNLSKLLKPSLKINPKLINRIKVD